MAYTKVAQSNRGTQHKFRMEMQDVPYNQVKEY